MQTSSVCLRRQLPRRGKPGKGELRRQLLRRGKPRKGELRRALLQRGKTGKERKTAVALDRAKGGKGGCGVWSRPLQSACADSFPEGEAEKGQIAQSVSTERQAEKGTKDSRGVGKAKRGKGWCGGWGRPLQSACADSFPEGGSRESRNDSAACGHKNR